MKMFRFFKEDLAEVKNEVAFMRFIKDKAKEIGMNPEEPFECRKGFMGDREFIEITQWDNNGKKN